LIDEFCALSNVIRFDLYRGLLPNDILLIAVDATHRSIVTCVHHAGAEPGKKRLTKLNVYVLES